MAKDPAFLFYPGDWLGGTMGFTFEIKGCYFELLIFQFNNGGKFTEAQAKQVLNGSFDVAWVLLKLKFHKEGQFYYNKRLLHEMERRTKFSESRRINGLQKKKEKIKPEAYAKHMEAETKTINETISSIVVYNAEEEILKNQIEFERICMATSKNLQDAKESLRKYHLYLEEKEQYPKGKKAVFAGFEKWLLNEKKYNNDGNKFKKNDGRSVGKTIEFD